MAFSAYWDNLVLVETMLGIVRTEIHPDHSNLPVRVTEPLLEISHNQAQVVLVCHQKVMEVEVQVKQLRV